MLRALTGRLARNTPPDRFARRATRRARLTLEALEARKVPSASTNPTYLLSSGKLYQESAAGQTLLDTGVRSFAIAPSASSGSVYILQSTGALLRSPNSSPGQFTSLEQGVKAVAVDATNKVFALQSNGLLLTSTTGLPGSFTLSDRLVAAIKMAAGGSVVVTDWFSQHLTDPGLAKLVRQEFTTDDTLARGDMLGLFAQAEADGTISGTELQSLRAVTNNPALLHIPSTAFMTWRTRACTPFRETVRTRAMHWRS